MTDDPTKLENVQSAQCLSPLPLSSVGFATDWGMMTAPAGAVNVLGAESQSWRSPLPPASSVVHWTVMGNFDGTWRTQVDAQRKS